MRNLIIRRQRSLAGCFGKVHVYINSESGELTIRNTSCKKLGELKNGEEKTFSIPNTDVTVYVIGDTLTKELCYPKQINAGDKDVHLSGKTTFDPQNGNPFVFGGES